MDKDLVCRTISEWDGTGPHPFSLLANYDPEYWRERRRTFVEDWKAAEVAVEQERRAAAGDLYFVRVGKFLKIGRTRNLQSRLRHIRCHSPTPPELVGSLAGKGWQEKEWHRAFRHLRSQGEWFKITKELHAAVEAALHPNAVSITPKQEGPSV